MKGPTREAAQNRATTLLNLAGNTLCAIDCSTSKLYVPGLAHPELLEIACIPLNLNLDTHSELKSLNILIRPSPDYKHAQDLGVSSSRFEDLRAHGVGLSQAVDIFEDWCKSVKDFDKKITPLAYCWPFDREIIERNLMGKLSMDFHFNSNYRDPMPVIGYLCDKDEMSGNAVTTGKVRHDQRKLTSVAEAYGIRRIGPKTAMSDALLVAQTYKALLLDNRC